MEGGPTYHSLQPVGEDVDAIRSKRHPRLPHDRLGAHAAAAVHVHAPVGHQVVHGRVAGGVAGSLVGRRVAHDADEPVDEAAELRRVELQQVQVRGALEEQRGDLRRRRAVRQVHEAVRRVEARLDAAELGEVVHFAGDGELEDAGRRRHADRAAVLPGPAALQGPGDAGAREHAHAEPDMVARRVRHGAERHGGVLEALA
mmetsp:Transcript_2264/g.6313  ORF Transcript_2264/g.6313 Transcript_2264/m.6313 type:complete len:201 (-) Transcript_2264:18-620(-)